VIGVDFGYFYLVKICLSGKELEKRGLLTAFLCIQNEKGFGGLLELHITR